MNNLAKFLGAMADWIAAAAERIEGRREREPDGMLLRLRKLVAAIDNEAPRDGVPNAEVMRLYALGKDGGELAATGELQLPRYLACASEGHWDSAFRNNPEFGLADAEEIEAWLARQYLEGWAGRWVVDLDTGKRLSWSTACEFDQDVERSREMTYTVLAVYRESGQPYATSVDTPAGVGAAEALAQEACRSDNGTEGAEDLLRIVAVVPGEHPVDGGKEP
jgi:hypothetical protein